MRFFMIIFALPFVGVPLAMLSMLWGSSGFGGPPLPMKLAGTLICGAVASAGVGMMYSAITGKMAPMSPESRIKNLIQTIKPRAANYECDNCGATLSDDADVSPSGDVKCQYCDSWFNVNSA